jgi:hypothetical protein
MNAQRKQKQDKKIHEQIKKKQNVKNKNKAEIIIHTNFPGYSISQKMQNITIIYERNACQVRLKYT